MLRDVPHCKSILTLGVAGMIVGVVMLTWVYPAFCSKVSQVKETKVREVMQDRYGIPSRSGTFVSPIPGANEELSKVAHSESAPAPAGGEAAEDSVAAEAAESITLEKPPAGAGDL